MTTASPDADDGKTFPDRCYDRPSRDRPPGGSVVREMGRRPRSQLMIVRQCRQGLERELLRIDQASVAEPVTGRHDQLLPLLEQHRALHQAVMGKRQPAERRIDLAYRDRLKLVQQRKLHPCSATIRMVTGDNQDGYLRHRLNA
jgi:hypothetical protein